jgi:hypothetical protein
MFEDNYFTDKLCDMLHVSVQYHISLKMAAIRSRNM